MRSTNFVVLSIMVHLLAVAAVAMSPQRISEPAGATVEVAVGEDSSTPGIPDSNASSSTAAPGPVEKVVEKQPTTPAPKAEQKPAAPKKVAVTAHKKSAPKQPTKAASVEPEKLDPENTEGIPAFPQASEPEEKAAETKEPEVKSEPAPVENAVAAATPAKDESKKEEAKAASVEKPSEASNAANGAVAEAAETGAKASGQAAETGELGQGGATQAGAVQYTELKQMRGNKTPAYPLSARRERREGDAELLYRVTREGRVTEVSVAKSSGHEDLDNEAVKAISKFRFVPGQEGWARHPVLFRLKGEAAALPSRLRTKVSDTND